MVLGEFGGLGLAIKGHTWSSKTWGYKGTANQAELTRKYERLLAEVWRLKDKTGLSAAVYKQTTDVETEATLSFHDAVDGTTVALRLTGEGACPTCHGTGAKSGSVPRVCPTCQGTGQSSRNLGSFAFSEPCKECRGRGLVVVPAWKAAESFSHDRLRPMLRDAAIPERSDSRDPQGL